MDKSYANGNGESCAAGDALPFWLKSNREFTEVYLSRFCFWTVMA